jgi:hypothetical protein
MITNIGATHDLDVITRLAPTRSLPVVAAGGGKLGPRSASPMCYPVVAVQVLRWWRG